MDMFRLENVDAFALVSSDGDLTGLASRLRRGGQVRLWLRRQPIAFGDAEVQIAPRRIQSSVDRCPYPLSIGSKPPSVKV